MSEGTHTLTATAANAAGTSPSSAPVSITVDTQPPTIGNPSPAAGSTITIATPVISASWSDATSGVNTSSAVILLDGATVSGASLSASGFSFGSPTLSNGAHNVSV